MIPVFDQSEVAMKSIYPDDFSSQVRVCDLKSARVNPKFQPKARPRFFRFHPPVVESNSSEPTRRQIHSEDTPMFGSSSHR